MITTTPAVAEVSAAMNLLSVLELAKDATAMKAALAVLKSEQDSMVELNNTIQANQDKYNALIAQAEKAQDAAAAAQAKAEAENAKVMQNIAEVEADRAAMRDQRVTFDTWMAAQREALDAQKAAVASQAAALNKFNDEMNDRQKSLADGWAAVDRAKADAEAMRSEYETKLASLKQLVGQ